MQVRFWGVRGSIPAPGPETNRYGGNTSCVSVRSRRDGHLFVLDMGTGFMRLGHSLLPSEFGRGQGKATILLSHSHWDHIQGFGFFPPIFIKGNQFRIHGHARSASMLEGALEGQMNPHFSPIYTLRNLGAEIEFAAAVSSEPIVIHGVTVTGATNPHGSTTAMAFRLEERGKSLVYASDVGYRNGEIPQTSLALYDKADVLIHDSTYTPEDQKSRTDRGLSSFECAAKAAVAADVRHLMLTHYDQDYSDDQVDTLRDRCRQTLDDMGGQHIKLTAAHEGLTFDL